MKKILLLCLSIAMTSPGLLCASNEDIGMPVKASHQEPDFRMEIPSSYQWDQMNHSNEARSRCSEWFNWFIGEKVERGKVCSTASFDLEDNPEGTVLGLWVHSKKDDEEVSRCNPKMVGICALTYTALLGAAAYMKFMSE